MYLELNEELEEIVLELIRTMQKLKLDNLQFEGDCGRGSAYTLCIRELKNYYDVIYSIESTKSESIKRDIFRVYPDKLKMEFDYSEQD